MEGRGKHWIDAEYWELDKRNKYQTWLSNCSSWFYSCSDKTLTKKMTWRKKEFTSTSGSQCILKGAQDKHPRQELKQKEPMTNTAYSWLAQPNSLNNPYYPPRWHHPQWAGPSQSLINKENASKACPRPICWRQFLNWGDSFLRWYSLVLNWQKLTPNHLYPK